MHPLTRLATRVLTVVGLVATVAALLAVRQAGERPPLVVGESTLNQVSEPVAQPLSQDPAPHGSTAVPLQAKPAWVLDLSARTGIPAPAMRAYANAELSKPQGCGLTWATLAGIGWVESHHGTIAGRSLLDEGRPSEPILGPALDGRGDFAAIPATPESTQWHSDPEWDHAVGPMQFISSTWQQWGTDGDGDGVADPNDLDDAAAAATAYLCADGHDFTTGDGWAGAVFGYNHDNGYVVSVHSAAQEYAERSRAE